MKGKKYEQSAKTFDRGKVYPLEEGIKILKGFVKAKFDETVEVHIRLNVSTKKVPQNVSGTVKLPAGTGKKVRVAVIAKGDKAKEAESAGADKVGYEDIIEEISKGKIDFDVLLTTPDSMRDVSKVARIIGPRGLMPTPKNGTATFEIAKALEDFKSGLVRWKIDTSGNIHVGSGKISFSEEDLASNVRAVVASVESAKIPFISGNVIKKITISSTMSPGVAVDVL
ncbi:MAG: 50S ribosomal protein L1 [Elusimicrobia bacterium]|nr:50S ribosomal protein L1 [Elusimicrobiota bacterium]